jgi:hypothetical protein
MRRLSTALLALAPLTLAACSTLSVESQASLPTGAPGFARTLVVVFPVLDDETRESARRKCEDALVGRLGALNAFASSAVFPSDRMEERPTVDVLVELARENGADGLVAMWLDAVTEKTFEEIPAIPFVENAAGPVYIAATPATEYVTFSARVEVVSVPDSRIRWTALVRGLEAYPPGRAAGAVATTVARHLRQDGLLQ